MNLDPTICIPSSKLGIGIIAAAIGFTAIGIAYGYFQRQIHEWYKKEKEKINKRYGK